MKKKVLVPVANGIEEIEAITIIDTLRRADVDVTVASVNELEIKGAHEIKIISDKKINDCQNEIYDLVVCPGGLPGAEHLRDSEVLIEILNKHKDQDRYIGAICASPALVLQSHGLLEGRSSTCYPSFMDLLSQPDKTSKVVVDGKFVTSQGPGTALEFSIKLVEILVGYEKAEELSKGMLVS